MSLSVDYYYQFALKLIKKNQAGGLKSKDFEAHWNDAQSAFLEDLLGRWQIRSNSKTGLNTGLIEDETVMQKISVFITPGSLTITSGSANKPDDFIYRLALRINGKDCYKINHNQIASVNDSVIDPPSTTNDRYYFVEYKGYYSFLPNTVTSASLDYVAIPENVVWGFTYDAQNRQVYNPGTSIQPKWDSLSGREITKRMLTTLGVSFKDNDFLNFGKTVEVTGE